MVDVPEPENYDAKEVFAFAGLGLYCGQVLEKGLVNLLIAFHADGFKITKNDYDEVFAKYDKQTLGQLLRQAKNRYHFSQQDIDLLQKALTQRNHLAHNFFANNAVAFTTNVGMEKMLTELQEMIQCFQEADQATSNIYWPILKRLGMTEEFLENLAEQMVQEFLADT